MVQSLQALLALHERVEAQNEVIEGALDVPRQRLHAQDILFDLEASFLELSAKLLVAKVELSEVVPD